MPSHRTLSLAELKQLISFDNPCLVGELSREMYILPKHAQVFQDLTADIQQNGITAPLRVVNQYLVDGHHRAIVAMELGLDEVPITYEGFEVQ
jgi:hypothetical protein